MMSENKFSIDDFNPGSIAEKIAIRMKAKRLALNMTQKTLASRSGVSLGSIKRFETTHRIALQSLLQIALVLDASVEFHQLFPMNQYRSIAEVLSITESQPRRRARDT